MNKKELITAAVMSIVSLLMIVGFTVAWYSRNQANATATGMNMMADEKADVIVALEAGGEDISFIASDEGQPEKYADMGLDGFTNTDGKMAPGTYGEITLYVTPKNDYVSTCSIVPVVGISAGEDEWYLGIEDGESAGSTGEETGDEEGTGEEDNDTEEDVSDGSEREEDAGEITLEELYEITQRHVVFFSDEAMTQKIDEENSLQLTWSDEDKAADTPVEKKITIYWKWYYEYPFSETENNELSEAEKQTKLDEYDDEDMIIGNNVTAMKFHFTFIVE